MYVCISITGASFPALDRQVNKLENQIRFIKEANEHTLRVGDYSEDQLVIELVERGYAKLPDIGENDLRGLTSDTIEDDGYNYLLDLPIRQFTRDNVRASTNRAMRETLIYISRPHTGVQVKASAEEQTERAG